MQFLTLSLLAATASATELLLPLYSAPGDDGANWDVVKTALANSPGVSAKIIINVDSGPGTPDANWAAGGKALSALPNVSLVGYVHSSLCQRAQGDVQVDVAKWASWAGGAGVDLAGIFIDEAPNDGSCGDYMAGLTSYIRDAEGLEVVVYNPGFPASVGALDAYYGLNPTFISALETCFATSTNGEDLCDGTYEVYDQAGAGTTIDSTLQDWVGADNYAKTAVLVHGFHDSNGMYDATADTLQTLLGAIVQRDIGAAVVTTNQWVTPDAGVADIQTVVNSLNTANNA